MRVEPSVNTTSLSSTPNSLDISLTGRRPAVRCGKILDIAVHVFCREFDRAGYFDRAVVAHETLDLARDHRHGIG